jgi:hypothetical protein
MTKLKLTKNEQILLKLADISLIKNELNIPAYDLSVTQREDVCKLLRKLASRLHKMGEL